MTTRRSFIRLLLGGVAAAPAWSTVVHAQSPTRPLIGVLSPISAASARPLIAAFRSALRDLGYVEGRNLAIAIRYGDGVPERMAPLARELVALNPDILVAGAQSGTSAARNATRTIPIVVLTPEDPVAAGIAQSLGRPGGNVTGTWMLGDDALAGKGLDFLKLAVPGLKRVGVVFNPDDPTDSVQLRRLPTLARTTGITVELIQARDLKDLDIIGAEIMRANVQALFIGMAPSYLSARAAIIAMAARLNLPAVYAWREYAEAGGLMSYGPNLAEMYRQSARLVDRILKGTKPAEVPFELPTRYELIVNLRTAKAIGIVISESFLLLADEVIE